QLRVPLRAAPGERVRGRAGAQHAIAVRQHDLALVLDELVVTERVPVDLQVSALGDALRVPHGPVRARVADPAVLVHLPRQGNGGGEAGGGRGVAGDQGGLPADDGNPAPPVALPAGA